MNDQRQNNDSGSDLGTHKRDVAEQVMSEVFRIIREEEQEYGLGFAHDLSVEMLSTFVATCVYGAMKAGNGNQNDTLVNYANAKVRVQEAVARGFEAACDRFAPTKPLSYICVIKPAAEKSLTAQ